MGITSYCLVGRNFEKWTDLEFLQQPAVSYSHVSSMWYGDLNLNASLVMEQIVKIDHFK